MDSEWVLAYAVIGLASFFAVSQYLPFPYMDEYFHVRQTLQYALGLDFTTWDPKITTPPGLYILGFVVTSIIGPSLLALRAINALSLPLIAPYVTNDPLLVTGFPLLAFFANLYYTDVWASLLVLWGLRAKSPRRSAVLLFLSLWFRQTNIIWAGVAAGFKIVENVTFQDVRHDWRRIFSEILTRLTHTGLPYITIASSFAVFLLWNGGIALGDKANHAFALHGAHILYFLFFFSLFSAPLALNWARELQIRRRASLIPYEIAAIALLIKYGTIVHPFILSDNRHYTFYIWRRLIVQFEGRLMVPVYWACWRWAASTVDFAKLQTWIYLLGVVAVLVPSPLMEPRYYILPYLVWRLYVYDKPPTKLEYAWYAAINCATVWVFCSTEAHFMW